MANPQDRFLGTVQINSLKRSRGVNTKAQYIQELGQVDAKDPDGICVEATATGAATLSATGALVSGGVGTFDVARGVSITSTGNESGISVTVTGTDNNGTALVDVITGPNNTTANGEQAFKTVTSVAVDGATTSTNGLNVGSSDVIGYDYRLADKGKALGVFVDGVPETTLTVVAGLAATGTATATTADVRGTFTPNTAPDGSKYFSAVMALDDDLSINELKGATPYSV